MKTASLVPIAALCMLAATGAQAQTTRDGTALTWNREIAVVDNSITVGSLAFPAHSITVFESDAGTVLDLWKNEYRPIASTITGSKILKAVNAHIAQLSDEPVLVLAEAVTEKKAGSARLTIAFLANDSTGLANEDGRQQRYLRDLAVKFNKAIVQAQIDRYQADLDKAQGKLSGTQDKKAKAQGNVAKANKSLDKTKSKRAKLQRDNAAIHGKISGLEKKFALSNDPKDLKRLTKERQSLAKNERNMAKLLQQESKAQSDLSKHQSAVDKAAGTEQGQLESKEELMRIISELKRKQDAIR
jgi:hypothetical protein